MSQSSKKQFNIVTALLRFGGMCILTSVFIMSLFSLIPLENYEQELTEAGMLNHIIEHAPFNFWLGLVGAVGLAFVTLFFFGSPVLGYIMGNYDEPQTE